jgi:hypothetical protein
MRHSHPTVLVGAGLVCLAWTTAAGAQQQPAPQQQPSPVPQPAPAAEVSPPVTSDTGATTSTSKTTNPDGSITTTTVVTTPVVVQPSVPVGTTRTTSFFERERIEAPSNPLDAPVNSLEMTLGTVYEQPFGRITQGQTLSSDSGGGGGVHLGLGYRIAPEFSLGLYGTGATFGRTDSADPTTHTYTASAGIEAGWHFLPALHRVDPWISIGSGWRGYWVNQSAGITAAQGWEIAKLQGGVDFRVDKGLALGPVVGADITTFFAESSPASPTMSSVTNPWANTFFFAGLQGRFDVQTTVAKSQVASR